MKLEIVFEDGRKETFDNVASFNVKEEECNVSDVAQPPTEGKLFKVNPLGIDRSNFNKPMRDNMQEWTRQIIKEAFEKVDKHPGKYAVPFYTLIPEKKWDGGKTVGELKTYACKLGDHIADWVEQALEWAQRICNGESWETVCNVADTASWYRLVVWKNGYSRLVGGSRFSLNSYPSSAVNFFNYDSYFRFNLTVPLVVRYKE